jgi:hypothetical protein
MLSYRQNIETKQALSEQVYFTTKQTSFPAVVSTNPEAISRLISAAVVDKSFCKLLLSKPHIAMTLGYRGEKFDLTEEDRSLILNIQAASLTDFAAQLIRLRENNSSGEWIVRKPVKVNRNIQAPLETMKSW